MVVNDSFIDNESETVRNLDIINDNEEDNDKTDLIDLTASTDDVRLQDDDDVDETEEMKNAIECQQRRQTMRSLSNLQISPSQPTLFKTTDRLISDLVNDVAMFDLGFESGILKLPTIKYAERLSAYLRDHRCQSELKFGLVNNEIEFAPSREISDNGIAIIRGFLFDPVLSRSIKGPIYNVKIVIKHDLKNASKVGEISKHGFYDISDDELTPDNRNDLIVNYFQIAEDAKTTYNNDDISAIKNAIPEMIDSGTFISSNTKALMRIELSKGYFKEEALKEFEDTAISQRLQSYLSNKSDAKSKGVSAPTASECFQSITRVIKGPLTHDPATDVKTISADHKIANVDAGISFMVNHLNFVHNTEVGELFPPNLSLPLVRESFKVKYLEALFFSKSTAVTLGDASVISRLLHESVDFGHAHSTSEEEIADSSISYITLSSKYRYSDNLIRDAYSILIDLDSDNELKYFDCLSEVAAARKTLNLKGYVSKLKSEGRIGYHELTECYRMLEITPDCYDTIDDKQLLQQYISLLIVTESLGTKEQLRKALSAVARCKRSTLLVSFLNAEPIPEIEKAYDILDVNENVDNDLIITANEIKKADYPSEANLYDRALLTIALQRKSFVLLEYIDKKLAYLNKSLDLDFTKAYQFLNADPLASDFQIITIFQETLVKDQGIDIRVLRQYLRYIGKQKKSKLISEYLKKGTIDPVFLPVESSPVGLNNIGNTCYLNSLLQYYFVIEPLRSAILNFNEVIDEEKFHAEDTFAKRRIGSRTVGFKETERSYQFVYQLRDLFEQLIKSKVRCISPKKELAYLSFSPSTDEVIFQMDSDVDASNKQLVHVPTTTENEGSPIIVDSKESSVDNSIITLDSSEFETQARLHAMKTEQQDAPEHTSREKQLNELQVEESASQSPAKRRLSSESYELVNNSNNKSANKGHQDGDTEMEGNDIMDNAPVDATKDSKSTSAATCEISADQMENALEMGRQQDVTECIQNVLFQLESAFKPRHLEEDDEQYDIIKELFYGKTKQVLQPFDPISCLPVESGNIRSKEERFLSLLVNIGDHPKDIYDALDTYFTEDVINMDDGDVKRSLTITELPKVLQIQIQRVQFDRERLMPVKSIEPIPFEENLYMDRYMETDDEDIINKRKEVFQWKHRISLLNLKKQEMSKKVDDTVYNMKDGLTVFNSFLKSDALGEFDDLSIQPDTMNVIDSLIKDINVQEEELESEVKSCQKKIVEQFKDFTKIGYSLFAIFIHRGEASYGHYWIYIRDIKRNVYRKYNDETITEVPIEEVFNFEETNTATPYFLVYVKDDLKDSYVDPLRRELPPHSK